MHKKFFVFIGLLLLLFGNSALIIGGVTNSHDNLRSTNKYYDITIDPDPYPPGWNEYDYAVRGIKIYRHGLQRFISVEVENKALCMAKSAWGWYSSNGKSCWGKWNFTYERNEVVNIKFRAGDSSPEPGATYRIELDGIYLGDAKIPATDSWYLVTIHNVSITNGRHTLSLGTYQMDYSPDIWLDYIMIGNVRIEAEEYNRTGGNDPNPDLRGFTVYPRDIPLQIWDGNPDEDGELIAEVLVGKEQLVIDCNHEYSGNTYYGHYIENNGMYTVEVPWNPSGKFIHKIYAIVDPYDKLDESNENNNAATKIRLTYSFPFIGNLFSNLFRLSI